MSTEQKIPPEEQKNEGRGTPFLTLNTLLILAVLVGIALVAWYAFQPPSPR